MSSRRPRYSPAKKSAPGAESGSETGVRLQKVLASAGLGSRRKCEELITAGRVEVDHQTVSELGTRVDPDTQEIRVDGETLKLKRRLYYAVHKPAGVVSTHSDPTGRPRVIDLIETQERLFTVGRLDLSSEGLILVTNDGELANRLAHPRYEVEKRYQVQVVGHPADEALAKLHEGVHLAEGVVKVEHLTVKRKLPKSTVLEMVLTEGKNREIRRMLARMGHKVVRLVRVALGPLQLGKLPAGGYRQLTPIEVSALRKASRTESSSGTKKFKKRGGFDRKKHGGAPNSPGKPFGWKTKPAGGAGQGRPSGPRKSFPPRPESDFDEALPERPIGKTRGTIIGDEETPKPQGGPRGGKGNAGGKKQGGGGGRKFYGKGKGKGPRPGRDRR